MSEELKAVELADRGFSKELNKIAIDLSAKLLLDSQLWSDVKMFVSDIDGADLSNEEKHAKVMKDLHFIFGDIVKCIANLAISLAVTYLKAK